MTVALALLAVLASEPPTEPSTQALIYYNARMALREGQPTEALKLWLLRNAVEQQTQTVSAHDPDFVSVTWAALGELALCPDGFPPDVNGAGIAHLAQHNYLVRTMRRGEGPSLASPWAAFQFGRQQRHISLQDVLDREELAAVRFERTPCWLHGVLLWETLEDFGADLRDREVTGRLLRYLLRRAQRDVDPALVRGRSVVEARIFDLELRLAGIAARNARREARRTRGEARRVGLTDQEIDAAAKIAPESIAGKVLAGARDWPADEWMALSSQRRQFLFAEATQRAPDPALDPVIVAIVDQLIGAAAEPSDTGARPAGELHGWLAYLGTTPERRRLAWDGERGRRLLALDRESGFREQSVIALHRGVAALEQGDLPAAIRAFAVALGSADTSAQADTVRNLSRRWLSFVAGRFRVTDELFAVLRSTVPRADYSAVLEDQVWQAAFLADAESYTRAVKHRVGRGAMIRRLARLEPLAKGDPESFIAALEADFAETPSATLRFLERFTDRLEQQDLDVRTRLGPALRRATTLIEVEAGAPGARRAEQLATRMRSLLDGLPDATIEPDRALDVTRPVHAGTVRVAPSDALPWPFRAPEVQAPDAFEPIALVPIEWRGDDGQWVFGWQIRDTVP